MRWFKKKQPETKATQFETILRLIAAKQGILGNVTPNDAMRSPTVHAIVTAISRRIASTPVHVFATEMRNGRESKEKIPNHPVAQLLRAPNEWQSRYDYWQDLGSALVRHGRYIAIIGRGSTGPIRRLFPMDPSGIEVKQDPETLAVSVQNGEQRWEFNRVHFIRGPSRDFFSGDSPVKDVATTIGLEIAAEEFGETFFTNGAVPLMFFKYMEGMKGFETPEQEAQFISDFQSAFSGSKRHKAMLLPPGLDVKDVNVENEKAQFLQTRQHQRSVIAGAFGVPPQFVGDLSRGTYNNVEQQSEDFTLNVIMPKTMAIEAAMERDLLTDDDRRKGVKIRFNLDAELRAEFIDRQTGLQIQLQNGVITPNEWREVEGRPPREDPGGNEFQQSVQTQNGASDEPNPPDDEPGD